MESRRYQNLYPDLSPPPAKDNDNKAINNPSTTENRPEEDDDPNFQQEMERAKMLSIITAQQEEKQRQFYKIASRTNSSDVPPLKPPPKAIRAPQQQTVDQSPFSVNQSKSQSNNAGLTRPKPIYNESTITDPWNRMAMNNALTVEITPRSHSVPPFSQNMLDPPEQNKFDYLKVDSNANNELIQLSPANSDVRDANYTVKDFDPLFSNSAFGPVTKMSESSNKVLTNKFNNCKNLQQQIQQHQMQHLQQQQQQQQQLTQYGFNLPTNLSQIPPPLPTKAPRGVPIWNPSVLQLQIKAPFPDAMQTGMIKHQANFNLPCSLSSSTLQNYGGINQQLFLPNQINPILSSSSGSMADKFKTVPSISNSLYNPCDGDQSFENVTDTYRFRIGEDENVDRNNNDDQDIDDDDLIRFPESISTQNPIYMSLADFDPLFNMQNRSKILNKHQKSIKSSTSSSSSSSSSSSLTRDYPVKPICPPRRRVSPSNERGAMDKKPAPPPNASSSSSTSSSLLPMVSIFQSQDRMSVIPDIWTDVNADNISRCFDFDWGDPDDPFSLCHLIMNSKRQQQQQKQQQQQQQQQLDKQLPTASVTAATAAAAALGTKDVVKRPSVAIDEMYELLEETPETADEEIQAFLQMVARIKLMHPINDPYSNSGIVISSQSVHKQYINMTVKLIISGPFIKDEIVFVSDVNSTVEHIVGQVLILTYDDENKFRPDMYIMKVFGCSEYLLNDSLLSDYEYVQRCIKLGKDIRLIAEHNEYIRRPFQRTLEDIDHPVYVPKALSADDTVSKLTRNKINILLETFYKEVDKLKLAVLQTKGKVKCTGVVQSVKAICTLLNNIETVDVAKSLKRLSDWLDCSDNTSSSVSSYDSFNENSSNNPMDEVDATLREVTRSVKCMIDMFCRAYHKEYRFKSFMEVEKAASRDISSLNDCLIIHLASVHRVPQDWRNIHSEYFIQCKLLYGGKQLGRDVWSKGVQYPINQSNIIWDEWLTFPETRLCDLPREAKLCFYLVGCRMTQNSTNEGQTKVKRVLSWVTVQLFNHQFELVQGNHLLGMWAGACPSTTPTNSTNTHSSDNVILQLNMQNFEFNCTFPKIEECTNSTKQDFQSLHPDDQEMLLSIVDKDPLVRLTEAEKEFLWQKRHYLYGLSSALPKVLLSIASWSWHSLAEVYQMLRDAVAMNPMHALQLLLPRFSDTIVRCLAVDKLRELPADDFCDLLPQLIQALKFEFYHTSALAKLLLERSATSVRVAHYFYWLLKDAADDIFHRKRYQLMFGALMSVVGEQMRNEFGKQEEFVNMLSAIADKVKAASNRDAVLQRELGNMWNFLQHKSVRLPTNPALEVNAVDVKSCSYFTSFTVPLKLALKNIDPIAGDVYVMFKAGDDLRQDMLTLQLVRIMDRLWLQEGLDLKMVTFRIQPTSLKRGFVELIHDSETLGKIQKKHGHGVTGSFRDRTIAEWLQMHNPSELDYQSAVDNFTASCAGYCLATYILGVCDRHNDNIMIKHSGHIFHIDFAKFLGDSQMLGAINRDRTPFILTSDMAYVINGGDKPTERFQRFVDLCCQALNVIRKNSGLFINLLSLMVLSGIPRVNESAPRYVRDALMPERSDAEAVAQFTRMVNTSLKSLFTQFNFFLHNLAQMKFSGHDEGMLLSFVPKTYSIQMDGQISSLELAGIQKRYNPEKYYIYIIRVYRSNQKVPSYILRRFSEFQELHRKLVSTFPLVQWPTLSGKIILGRSHVKSVAEARKQELEVFIKSLLTMNKEISEHDLIYTFFHPMLRDEQELKTNLLKLKDIPQSPTSPGGTRNAIRVIEGSIKLSIFYKPHGLTVMVMHVKDLSLTSNGEVPSPYVKLYLLPDPMKMTKRKTKIAKNTSHPTYNEMLIYRMPVDQLIQRVLQVTVWSYDGLKENEFLGGILIRLSELDFTKENVAWYKLQNLHITTFSNQGGSGGTLIGSGGGGGSGTMV